MGNLGDLRQKRNFTRKELAEKVGVTEVYICYLEIGKRKNPSAKIAMRLAKALSVEVKKLTF